MHVFTFLQSIVSLAGSKKGLSHLQKYVIIGKPSTLFSKVQFYYCSITVGHCVTYILPPYIQGCPSVLVLYFYHPSSSGGQFVAVKVLTETDDNAQDFINEVSSISKTSHVNIVNLLGFCYDRKKRALVYEFMPNKSLDKFIPKNGPSSELDWEKLYEIAVGVARGLEYLHSGCNTRIVHFDIKPQNILLDEDFCPKISDFGLAKLFKKKQSVISMLGTRGTVGYIAPEVFSRNFGVVSHKSDVYSYGMMLLEMAGAKTAVEIEGSESGEIFFHDKIYENVLIEADELDDLMGEEKEESARKMLLVGLWCIQTAPSDRPSMTKVVEMLEGSLRAIQIPPKPFVSTPLLSPQISSSYSATAAPMHFPLPQACGKSVTSGISFS